MAIEILVGDCRDRLAELASESVHCCVTSPPYFGLRDYGHDGQMGLEPTPDEFVAGMVEVFREVRRVLRDDGTLWLNIGDSYASFRDAKCVPQSVGGGQRSMPVTGAANRSAASFAGTDVKSKDLIGIPWMLAFALRADGWFLRQDIIWSKPNPMPESVKDRCTKAHEYLFMLSKSPRYFYDQDAMAEPAIYAGIKGMDETGFKNPMNFKGKHAANPGVRGKRKTDKQRGHGRRHDGFNDRWDKMKREEQCSGTRNKRSVWNVATRPYSGAHFATYPPELIEPCILAGCPEGGTVLDPFFGAGTTGLVADRLQRNCIGIELNPEYAEIARARLVDDNSLFGDIKVKAA